MNWKFSTVVIGFLMSQLIAEPGWSTKRVFEEDCPPTNVWPIIGANTSLHPRLQLSHTCKTFYQCIQFDFDFKLPEMDYYFPALLKSTDFLESFKNPGEITLSVLQHWNRQGYLNDEPVLQKLISEAPQKLQNLFRSLSARKSLRSCVVDFDSSEWSGSPNDFFSLIEHNPIAILKLYTRYSEHYSVDILKPLNLFLGKTTTLETLELYGTSFSNKKFLATLAKAPIKHLTLHCDLSSEKLAKKFISRVCQNMTLRSLEMDHNLLGDPLLPHLIDALKKRATPLEVSLLDNHFSHSGILSFKNAITVKYSRDEDADA